mmetsp:Transcript_19152/g.41238  ORF Transcript_19152/g.41238 Transcript_19152/m.41238 type:complete len:202 (+) Transcript_19152:27-632(+)
MSSELSDLLEQLAPITAWASARPRDRRQERAVEEPDGEEHAALPCGASAASKREHRDGAAAREANGPEEDGEGHDGVSGAEDAPSRLEGRGGGHARRGGEAVVGAEEDTRQARAPREEDARSHSARQEAGYGGDRSRCARCSRYEPAAGRGAGKEAEGGEERDLGDVADAVRVSAAQPHRKQDVEGGAYQPADERERDADP